jgi:hypothetical protein
MLDRIIHRLHHIAQLPGERRFLRALGRVEEVQRGRLAELLAAAAVTERGKRLGISAQWTYEEMAQQLPITDYGDYAADVALQRESGESVLCGECPRYEPSSGSTQARKWIPYSASLLAEFDGAIGPWLADVGRRHPGTLRGRHYWSLSWLPDELRDLPTEDLASTDDLELLPWWKRTLLGQVMAVTGDVSRLPTADESIFETLCRLVTAKDLSLLSVWSPTFALELVRRLSHDRNAVANELRRRGELERADLLNSWDGSLEPEFLQRLWPRLAMISAWENAGAAPFARQLRELLPHAAFQAKGLWATEGVVTIPFRQQFPLAINSHFYEFRNLDGEQILPAWELEEGMEVQPLLTAGNGFFRYALDDRMRVAGFLDKCPCLEFRGRLGGVDLVGEKLDNTVAQLVIDQVNEPGDYCAIALLGITSGKRPRYRVLAASAAGSAEELAHRTEAALRSVHHYALARDLGQLDPVEAVVRDDIVEYFYRATGRKGLAGGRKVDPLALGVG